MADFSCKFPWSVRFIRLNDDSWKYCCKVKYNSYDHNTNLVKEVKNSFLKGERHKDCIVCWLEEDKGGRSFRLLNKSAKTTIEAIRNDPSLEILDIEFGDVCNMYCMTCGPKNSTTWQKITGQEGQPTEKFQLTLERIETLIKENPTIKHINMHGGEPSMDQNFSTTITGLINAGFKNKIRIITNGNYSEQLKTKFENSIYRLIDNGNDVEIIFSLDAGGIDGEWIRGGLKLKRFKDNLLEMNSRNVNISINISVSILNIENHLSVLHLLESIDMLDRVTISINTVNSPVYFSILNLGNKVNEFLPKDWPENMSPVWEKYFSGFNDFISIQEQTSKNPDTAMIKKLISTIKNYELITKDVMPDYYKNLIARLEIL